MAENLNFGTRVSSTANGNVNNQGDATAESAQKYCYHDSTKYCDTYGGLYQWHTAMAFMQAYDSLPIVDGMTENPHRGICPAGRHIPDSTEWDALFTAVGGQSTTGTALKTSSGWKDNGNGTDAYGFSALPSGFRHYSGSFSSDVSSFAYFWFSSEDDAGAVYTMSLGYARDSVNLFHENKRGGFSVRCVKD
jgi:uncharacterized protein (TIGR02145 family)